GERRHSGSGGAGEGVRRALPAVGRGVLRRRSKSLASDFDHGRKQWHRLRVARHRYLKAQVESDLSRKMVFVAGPRQVGKTTLAKSLRGAAAGYLSWDVAEDRERILLRQL